jgi:transketolase
MVPLRDEIIGFMSIADLQTLEILRDLRRRIITASSMGGEGHIPSALSILDIIWVVYDRILRFDSRMPRDEARDRFVLSKGHASLALYAVLAAKGFFPMTTLDSFGKFDSILGGHPCDAKVPGVEASTGSLGHGLPIATGIAMGLQIRGMRQRTFCLIGDGESNEGTNWEAASLASHHRLSNLCCIVDYNHSTDRALLMGDIGAKFSAFGWHVIEVDGHDHEALFHALMERRTDMPACVVASTIKGHGCSLMENNPVWHHRAPSVSEIPELIRSLS